MHTATQDRPTATPAAPSKTAGPTVTAVVTAYNSAAYIHRALESILTQQYPASEVIVVDDGSQDGTADVIEARFGDRVRVIRQENRGPNAARNRGARAGTGEWIAYLDADDSWTPQRLAVQIPFTSRPEIGLISGYGVCHDPHDIREGIVTFEQLWQRNHVGVPTSLIRRATFEEVGGFDEDRELVGAEDYNMWLRIAHSRWQVYMVPVGVFHYTSAPGSLYSQKERCLRGEMLNIRKLGERFQLPPAEIRAKQAHTLHEYGLDHMQARRVAAARRCYWDELKLQFSRSALMHWASTFIPVSLLDLRRRLRGTPPTATDATETC